MLELKRVSKQYDGVTALEPTDLELTAGQTYVLLGPSGCGKSTLLKLTLGLVRADTGSVWIGGQQLLPSNVLELRRRIGYVIQNAGLFPHLTAAENVALAARYLGWSRTRTRDRLEELAGLTQLSVELLERYPAQLSGGQQQRVGLMRALMLEPDLLLMDEPLGALDPMIRSDLQNDLRAIFRSLGKTVVIVTHDLHEAAFFADEIVLLRRGRILQRGSVNDLLDAPAAPFVTQFVNAQRTMFDGASP